MARTQLTVRQITRLALLAATTPPAADVANGNVCTNDGCTFFAFTNTDVVPRNVTVQVASGVDGLTAGPRTYPLPVSAASQYTGIFPVLFYGNTLLINADSTNVKISVYTVRPS